MTRFTVGLCFLILLPGIASGQTVTETLSSINGETWETETQGRTQFWTATGDTALVLSNETSFWIRARVDGSTWVACPDIGANAFRLEDLSASADSVLFQGADRGMNGTFMTRAQCVTSFAAVNDSIP